VGTVGPSDIGPDPYFGGDDCAYALGGMVGYVGMDLRRFLALVRARWWLLAAIMLVAAGFALGVSLTQPDRFQASAELLFGRTTAAETVAGGADETVASPQEAATNVALASLDTVAARVKQRFPATTIDDLKGAVTVNSKGNSDLVTVTAEWSTPTGAARVANAFADQIVALRRETAQGEVERAIDAMNETLRQREAASAGGSAGQAGTDPDEIQLLRDRIAELEVLKELQTGGVQVVQRATPPEERSSPRPARYAIIAALLGLVLGLIVLVLLARFDERIQDEDELLAMFPAPVMARIPEEARSRRLGQIRTVQEESLIEAFDFLRLNLQLLGPRSGSQVVAVTSPVAGDGKTTVVGGLARSLASSGEEVVVVDLNLRNPMLHSYFELPPARGRGVLDALLEPGSADDYVQVTSQPQLCVLPATLDPVVPSALLGSGRLETLLEQLRKGADYVLLDTPPVSAVADASAIATAADGVILVIDLTRTHRKELLVAAEQLHNARARTFGIVLDRASARSPAQSPRDRGRVHGHAEPSQTPFTFEERESFDVQHWQSEGDRS
jgi:polysaccharide biosynthesis transport protein